MTRATPTLLIANLSAWAAWQLKPEKEQPPPAPALVSMQKMGALLSLKVNHAMSLSSMSARRGIAWQVAHQHMSKAFQPVRGA